MLSNALRRFFPFTIAITLLSIMAYTVAQQSYRMAANDPQEMLTSQAAARIQAGEKPDALVGTATINIAKDESVFMVVYDSTGKVVAGNSVVMDGQAASVPTGAITYALKNGVDRITWQPKAGVREATIIRKVDASTVVAAGRSLTEPEGRVGKIGMGVAFGWVITLLATFLAVAVGESRGKK